MIHGNKNGQGKAVKGRTGLLVMDDGGNDVVKLEDSLFVTFYHAICFELNGGTKRGI